MGSLITAEELKQLMDKEDGLTVLIDVREQKEYDAASIPGSVLIPTSELDKADLSRYKDKKIVFHCQSGRRSAAACEMFEDSLDVSTLEGGIYAWSAKGFPVDHKEEH